MTQREMYTAPVIAVGDFCTAMTVLSSQPPAREEGVGGLACAVAYVFSAVKRRFWANHR